MRIINCLKNDLIYKYYKYCIKVLIRKYYLSRKYQMIWNIREIFKKVWDFLTRYQIYIEIGRYITVSFKAL